jgi:hypothetical protein
VIAAGAAANHPLGAGATCLGPKVVAAVAVMVIFFDGCGGL